MRRPNLARLLKSWCRTLGLETWDIDLHYRKKMDRDGDVGDCDAEPTNRTALINVLDPDVRAHDVELTLVHELLHVHTWWTRINGARSHRNIVGEQSIEAIAKALVSLRRREVRK